MEKDKQQSAASTQRAPWRWQAPIIGCKHFYFSRHVSPRYLPAKSTSLLIAAAAAAPPRPPRAPPRPPPRPSRPKTTFHAWLSPLRPSVRPSARLATSSAEMDDGRTDERAVKAAGDGNGRLSEWNDGSREVEKRRCRGRHSRGRTRTRGQPQERGRGAAHIEL